VAVGVAVPALHVKVKNSVFRELFRLSREEGEELRTGVPVEDLKEPLEHVRLVQEVWQMRLRGAVVKLSSETKTLLAKPVRDEMLWVLSDCVGNAGQARHGEGCFRLGYDQTVLMRCWLAW